MTDSQDNILFKLKRYGPQTVKQLADRLDMTTMGARQHLQALEKDGLVVSMPEVAQPRGRPVRPWGLTERGHARFPDAHADATVELIVSVREVLGEDALSAIIANRTEKTREAYAEKLAGLPSLGERVAALATLRTDEGYMARADRDGDDWLLIEDHCPICAAAEACQGFCASELETFQGLFSDAQVEREAHLLKGAQRCVYRIRPNH